jgi:hypothetical protein
MCVADVVVLALMGVTAEYLTYGGVGQTFWMVVGLLAGGRSAPAGVATSAMLLVRPAKVAAHR